MAARLTTLWESVSTSLWFVPAVLALCAVMLAWLTLSYSLEAAGDRWLAGWLHRGSAEESASLLSSLLTAMITMATVAISITMVVLQLAAGQLGPRLIRSFMADKKTQTMLGIFLATIVYLLLVLHSVNGRTVESGVPHLAVTTGSLGVLLSVAVMFFFVHHLARSIVADSAIQRVGQDLDAAIAQMLPPPGETCHMRQGDIPALDDAASLHLERGGYVRAIDYAGLVECAREAQAVFDLGFRPGQHLLPGSEHGRIAPAAALTDALRIGIANGIVLGNTRTASQDLEFAIRQLVEVALRALSPGINDEFTAIAAIDRLGISLARVMARGDPDSVWRDSDGVPRVLGKTTEFRGIVDAAFNQIRQAGSGHPAILIRILAVFARLAEQIRNEEHRRVLTDHVNMVFAAGKRSIPEPRDMEAMEQRRARALARLGAR